MVVLSVVMLGHGCNAPLFGRHASVIHAIIVHKPLVVHAIIGYGSPVASVMLLSLLGSRVRHASCRPLVIRYVIGRIFHLYILC